MKLSPTSAAGIAIAICILAAVSSLNLIAADSTEESQDSTWLSSYRGGPVNVLFEARTRAPQPVKARLIRAEAAGVVLRLPKENDTFFPYSHILSIQPL